MSYLLSLVLGYRVITLRFSFLHVIIGLCDICDACGILGMELVSFGKEVLQNIAEHVASYRIGQSLLRQCDRALWVVEKTARWAVPPPLDADDRPQPELIRPLPWVFFLALVVTLRLTRESLSLVNLILGKPPLRPADIVTYIQSKRRYLRTLKYQGNRMMRARSSGSQAEQWRGWRSLFEFTMCFRRSSNYGNNNNASVNNEEVLVVKRKRSRTNPNAASSSNDDAMERLIDQMIVDLNAESDEDSSYTLTNATSLRSIESEDTAVSDEHAEREPATPSTLTDSQSQTTTNKSPNSVNENENDAPVSSTPKNRNTTGNADNETPQNEEKDNKKDTNNKEKETEEAKNNEDKETKEATNNEDKETIEATNNEHKENKGVTNNEDKENKEKPEAKETLSKTILPSVDAVKKLTPKEQTLSFLQSEMSQATRKSSKKLGASDRRDSDVPVMRITPTPQRQDTIAKGNRKPNVQ